METSYFGKVLIALCVVTIAALIALLTVVRPRFEASAVAERLNNIQELQSYSMENIDRTIISRANVTRFIAGQVIDRPNDGETVLRSMMTLHPDIIQIKIHSPNLSDELSSQNTAYPSPNSQVRDDEWIHSKTDPLLQAAWLIDSMQNRKYFVTQVQFQVENTPFTLMIFWDTKQLNDDFSAIPVRQNYSVSVQSPSAVLMQNQSYFNPAGAMKDPSDTLKSMIQGKLKWRVAIKEFQSIRLSMVVAVPEQVITESVEELMIYSASLIIVLMSIVFITCVFLFFRTKRLANKKRIH